MAKGTSVYQTGEPNMPTPAIPNPAKFFPFTGDSVPDHSGDTPGPDASRTDVNWAAVGTADGDGSNVSDNDYDDPGSINSGLSHTHPAFGRATGNRY